MDRSSCVSFFSCCEFVLILFLKQLLYTEKRTSVVFLIKSRIKCISETSAFPNVRSKHTRTKVYYVRNMHVTIAQRNAWQVQLPRHSKQTNFHELRFHEACFRETAVLSFNCSGTVHGKIITFFDASLHCLPGNGTERKADTQSARKSPTMTRWSLFRETQTMRGFAKHHKRGSIRPALNRSE